MLNRKPFCKMNESTQYHMICALVMDIKDDLLAPDDFCYFEYDHSLRSYKIWWKSKNKIHHKLVPVTSKSIWKNIELSIRDAIYDTEDLEID